VWIAARRSAIPVSVLLISCSAPDATLVGDNSNVDTLQRVRRQAAQPLPDAATVGEYRNARISPDGQLLLLESAVDGGLGIRRVAAEEDIVWVDQGTLEWSRLNPAWSPTGDAVAFVRTGPGPGGLLVASADDEYTPRLVCKIETNGVTNASWSPDGSQLAVAVAREAERERLRTDPWFRRGHAGAEYEVQLLSRTGELQLAIPLPSGLTPLDEGVSWSRQGDSIAMLCIESKTNDSRDEVSTLVIASARDTRVTHRILVSDVGALWTTPPQWSATDEFIAVGLNGGVVAIVRLDGVASGQGEVSPVDLGEYKASKAVWVADESALVVCGYKEVTPILRQMVQSLLSIGERIDREYEYGLWLVDPQTIRATQVSEYKVTSGQPKACEESLVQFRSLTAAWAR
jgi:dipeptidyl aminopeptidase/acylaminoacyl peptidase